MTDLDDEYISELREDFEYVDANADGRIDIKEFTDLLDGLEAFVSNEEAKLGFEEIDTDKDGAVTFAEFVAWWGEQ